MSKGPTKSPKGPPKPPPGVQPKAGTSGSEVGYRKPPRQHQFKPGQSGNPKGRPKGSKNESTILREILQHKIAIRGPNGRVRKISVMEGIHRTQADQALKGDIKSAGFLFNRYAALVSGELQPQDMSDDDRAVLEAFAQRSSTRKEDGGQS
jgi:hypothetical protein